VKPFFLLRMFSLKSSHECYSSENQNLQVKLNAGGDNKNFHVNLAVKCSSSSLVLSIVRNASLEICLITKAKLSNSGNRLTQAKAQKLCLSYHCGRKVFRTIQIFHAPVVLKSCSERIKLCFPHKMKTIFPTFHVIRFHYLPLPVPTMLSSIQIFIYLSRQDGFRTFP
jgi:hypothetical protein